MSRHLLLAVGLVLAGAGSARADDIDRILGRDKVAAEALLSKVSASLSESMKLEKSSPATAVFLLEKRIDEVRDARFLGVDERNAWLGKLQLRLRQVNETLRAVKLATEESAIRAAEEAARKMREESVKKGSGVGGSAKTYIGSVADQIAAADRLRKDRAVSNLDIFRDIEVTASTITGAVEYGKRWEWILKNRTSGSKPKLTEKEVALLQTLNSTMAVDFDGRKFREVIDYLQEKTGLVIFVDKNSLEEAGIDYDDPVTFKVPKASVRTVLKKILADRNLTYIIKEGSLQVMTPMKAREMMVVRVYPVQDLVGTGDPRFDPFTNRAIMINNVLGLIKTLQSAVEPSIWDVNGGPGSIIFNEATMSLVIRAPAELHYMMGSGSLFR